MIDSIRKIIRRFYYNIRCFIFDYAILNIYAYSSKPAVNLTAFLRKIEIINASREESFNLISLVGESLEKTKFKSRIANGSLCFVALFNNKPVHFSWVSLNKMYIQEIRYFLRLKNNQAYIYHCFTAPEFRGKGIYPFVLLNITDYLRKNNINNIFISAVKKNISSYRGIMKAGFQLILQINYLRLLGIKFYHERWLSQRYAKFTGRITCSKKKSLSLHF